MRWLNFVGITLILVVAGGKQTASAQMDPQNVPKPPTAELAKLRPFLGLYEQTMDFAGLAWSGTLEVSPAVKGWYVEWVINTHHEQKIDRQLRMLMTWDRRLHKYRVWRFSTVDAEEGNEGEARFEGNELIMEWQTRDPRTAERVPAHYRNRITMKGPDELVIVTEGQRAGGKVEQIGITKARRRL